MSSIYNGLMNYFYPTPTTINLAGLFEVERSFLKNALSCAGIAASSYLNSHRELSFLNIIKYGLDTASVNCALESSYEWLTGDYDKSRLSDTSRVSLVALSLLVECVYRRREAGVAAEAAHKLSLDYLTQSVREGVCDTSLFNTRHLNRWRELLIQNPKQMAQALRDSLESSDSERRHNSLMLIQYITRDQDNSMNKLMDEFAKLLIADPRNISNLLMQVFFLGSHGQLIEKLAKRMIGDPQTISKTLPHFDVLPADLYESLMDKIYYKGIDEYSETNREIALQCLKNVLQSCPVEHQKRMIELLGAKLNLMFFYIGTQRGAVIPFITSITHELLNDEQLSVIVPVIRKAFFRTMSKEWNPFYQITIPETLDKVLGCFPQKWRAELFDTNDGELIGLPMDEIHRYLDSKIDLYIDSFLEKNRQNFKKVLHWQTILTPEIARRLVADDQRILNPDHPLLGDLLRCIPIQAFDAVQRKYPDVDLYTKVQKLLYCQTSLLDKALSWESLPFLLELFQRFPERMKEELQIDNIFTKISAMPQRTLNKFLMNVPLELQAKLEQEWGAFLSQHIQRTDMVEAMNKRFNSEIFIRWLARFPKIRLQLMSRKEVSIPLDFQLNYGARMPLTVALEFYAHQLENPNKLDEGAFLLLKEQLQSRWRNSLDRDFFMAKLCVAHSPALTLKLAPLWPLNAWKHILPGITTEQFVDYLKSDKNPHLSLEIVQGMSIEHKRAYLEVFPLEKTFFPDWEERIKEFDQRLQAIQSMEEGGEKHAAVIVLKREFSTYAYPALGMGSCIQHAKDLAKQLHLDDFSTVKSKIETRGTKILKEYHAFNDNIPTIPLEYEVDDVYLDFITSEIMKNPIKSPALNRDGTIRYIEGQAMDESTLSRIPIKMRNRIKDQNGIIRYIKDRELTENTFSSITIEKIQGRENPLTKTWCPLEAYQPDTALKERFAAWLSGLPAPVRAAVLAE